MVSNVYQDLFEHTPNALILTQENQIIAANPACASLCGYTKLELANQPVSMILLNSLAVPEFETHVRHKNGKTISVDVRRGGLPDQSHELLIIRDNSRRKSIEQGLIQSKTLLQSFVRETPAAVAMFDRDLNYLAFSNRWLTDYNLGQRDLTGLHHYDVFPEIRAMPDWQEIHKRCLEGATVKRKEEIFPRKDGLTDWIRWEVKPWYENGGRIGGLMMITEVITARKVAEEALRLSEERFSRAFRSSPVALAISRYRDGLIVDVNETFLRYFEYEREEVLGRTSTELGLFGPGDRSALTDQARMEDIKQFELTGYRKSGAPIDMLVSAQVISLAGESHLLSTGIDISERKNAERARAVAEAEAKRKSEELERFASTVSHDLRSPLITIRSFGDFVRESILAGDSDKALEELNYVMKAANRMDALLEELGELSRLGKQDRPFVICDLQSILADALDLAAGRVATARMQVKQDPIPFKVRCERRRLIDVFQNLIDNAAKFAAGELPALHIAAEQQSNDVIVILKDNGMGIEAQYMDRIFELFERLNHDKEGSGMGLALARRIVELHGGRIWCHSDGPGKGSAFYCALPIAE